MRVDGGAAIAGEMFHHGEHAARHQPAPNRVAERGDGRRIAPERAISDRLMQPGAGDIEKRRAVHVDPAGGKLMRNQPVAQDQRLGRSLQLPPFYFRHRGRELTPVRRAETLDAPALLIDQHRRGAAHRIAQIGGQRGKLRLIPDVPGEDDEAPWVGRAEEIPLPRRQLRALKAEDQRRRRHQRARATMQASFRA